MVQLEAQGRTEDLPVIKAAVRRLPVADCDVD